MVKKEWVNASGDKVRVVYSPESRLWHGYNLSRFCLVTARSEFLSVAIAAAETGQWLSMTELAESIR